MKIFFHFSVTGFSNSYLIGQEDGGDAILIDPGVMDIELLKLIEDNNYYIKYILLTHRHTAHIEGIKTIKKIYNAEIYANSMNILEQKVHTIGHNDVFKLAGISIKAIQVPGHSSDSLVYVIDKAMFTGDVLSSGKIGTTDSELSRSLLLRSIRERILPLDERMRIFPGHGSPTTLKAEKMFNPDIIFCIQQQLKAM
ncbi:MAG: MBL fold metallo-hydrolase [Spirochaetia bacterium]|nr:MBL fold metallo-hydrolase [Spirochaetia bacterium]